MQKNIKYFSILIVCLVLAYNNAGSAEIKWEESIKNQTQKELTLSPNYGNVPLYFIPNKGQVGEKALFYTKTPGCTLWLTKEGLVFDSTRRIQESESRIQNENEKQKIKDEERKENPKSETNPKQIRNSNSQNSKQRQSRISINKPSNSRLSNLRPRSVSRLLFIGANNNPEIIPVNAAQHRVNYFMGSDKSKWRHNIPTSKAVLYKNIYDNIDLKIYGTERSATAAHDVIKRFSSQKKFPPKTSFSSKNSIESQIEYDWIVKPGGNPGHIRFAYHGVTSTRIDKKGNLVIETEAGEMIHKKPVSYQTVNGNYKSQNTNYKQITNAKSQITNETQGSESDVGARRAVPETDRMDSIHQIRRTHNGSPRRGAQHLASQRENIEVTFKKLTKNTYGLATGNYDKTRPLIIDPVVQLVYSTYLGGSRMDRGYDITVDSRGCAYITGDTDSTDFPTADAFQAQPGGTSSDIFVTKFTAAGDALEYSTYLGGNHFDVGYGIAVDNTNCAYITGRTYSKNFPVANPIRKNHGGGDSDSFVCELSADGSELVYSTYLGGGGFECGSDITVDSHGAAYVTGYTKSPNFPVENPIQEYFGGGSSDAFITKLSAGGGSFLYSTYLGGGYLDQAAAIAVDAKGCAYITGFTSSLDFPTEKPYQPDRAGSFDSFVSKLSPDGSLLVYSTYLGGSKQEGYYYWTAIGGIAVDSSGYAFVTGCTLSKDFPTKNAYQGRAKTGYEVYLTKFTPGGSGLEYSTYLGGGRDDFSFGLAIDREGNVYVSGKTTSGAFPLKNAYQDVFRGGRTRSGADLFVTKFAPSGEALIYSTYLGSSSEEHCGVIAVDFNNCVYVTGYTSTKWAPDFPTKNPFQANCGGGSCDAFVTKMTDDFPPAIRITAPDAGSIVSGTVRIRAKAEDDVGIDRVDFYIDDELQHSDKQAPYNYEWISSYFSNGSHTIKAEAVDTEEHKTADEIDVTTQNVILDLSVERKVERAWLIRKDYGKIDLSIDNPGNLVVNKYVIYRKESGGEYRSIKEIPGSELNGNNYSYNDLDLEKAYYYMAKAFDGSGDTIGVSQEQDTSQTGATKKLIIQKIIE